MNHFIRRWLQRRAEGRAAGGPEEWARPRSRARERDEIQAVWELTDLAEIPVEPPPPPPVNEILRRAGAPARAGAPPAGNPGGVPGPRRRFRRPPTRRALQAAAVLAVGIGIGVLTSAPEPDGSALAAAGIETGEGERATVTLEDGTIVHVAPGSGLRFPEGPDRTVELEGRAFFAVADDEDRPFRVRTHGGEARVLGTRFDLRADEDELELLVVEGRVGVSAPRGEAEVEESELTRWSPNLAPTVEPVEDAHALLEWMGRTLVFQATPLEDVARELERRYRRDVELADPALADFEVTAWFSGQEFEEVVLSVCQVVAAECDLTRKRAVIGHRAPAETDVTADEAGAQEE